MLQQIINYFKNVFNTYAVIYYDPYYNNLSLPSPQHFYDDKEYKIKDTIYKNGKVQPSNVERI